MQFIYLCFRIFSHSDTDWVLLRYWGHSFSVILGLQNATNSLIIVLGNAIVLINATWTNQDWVLVVWQHSVIYEILDPHVWKVCALTLCTTSLALQYAFKEFTLQEMNFLNQIFATWKKKQAKQVWRPILAYIAPLNIKIFIPQDILLPSVKKLLWYTDFSGTRHCHLPVNCCHK